jgi:hypothetical protein
MCDCAFGSIEPSTAPQKRARGVASLWKFAALRQSLRSALRALRVQGTSHARPAGRART